MLNIRLLKKKTLLYRIQPCYMNLVRWSWFVLIWKKKKKKWYGAKAHDEIMKIQKWCSPDIRNSSRCFFRLCWFQAVCDDLSGKGKKKVTINRRSKDDPASDSSQRTDMYARKSNANERQEGDTNLSTGIVPSEENVTTFGNAQRLTVTFLPKTLWNTV